MGSSNIQVYIHFVWHTDHRKPLLRGQLETFVHDRIRELAGEHGLQPLAINSAWTHTHLLVRWNATSAIGDVVEDWKGLTSLEWEPTPDCPQELSWQKGYGAFSHHKDNIDTVIRYIAKQKHHHRHDTTIEKFERQ